MTTRDPYMAAARIIQDAGGELVGRTRLQKVAFFLKESGFSEEFSFNYKHYGPYSEELAEAIEIASALGPIKEEERIADWGGRYSIYTLKSSLEESGSDEESDPERAKFVREAMKVNAIELELAATAAYIFIHEKIGDKYIGNPWEETRRRKPSKATGDRLQRAALAYEKLRHLPARKALPELPQPENN